MFEVKTVREEKAYRLGYVEGRAGGVVQAIAMMARVTCSPTVYSPREIYERVLVYQVGALRSWRNEETPKIREEAPEFVIL